MPKTSTKFYAVRIGRQKGVFNTWPECKIQIEDYPGARYKSFETVEEANEFAFGKSVLTPYSRGPQKDTSNCIDLDPSPPMKKPGTFKFYAVANGRAPGIYLTWEECKKHIEGHGFPVYKSFFTRAEAEQFIEEHKKSKKMVKRQSPMYGSLGTESQPSSQDKENVGNKENAKGIADSEPQPALVIYTDGACQGQGPNSKIWRGGVGVYFGPNDPRNISEKLTGAQTNNRAELTAIIRALQTAPKDVVIEIRTDSQYCINSITQWMPKWKQTNFLGIKNPDLMMDIDALLMARPRNAPVLWTFVRGHRGDKGNEAADRLAVAGARLR